MKRTWKCALSVALAVSALGLARCAAQEKGTYTDPANVPDDFAVQGEYVGELPGEDGQQGKWGAQIIALDNDKFDMVAYKGGLPGDGWKRGDERLKAQGQTKDGATRFSCDKGTAEWKDGALTVMDTGGTKLGTLKKVERKSPTLAAKPPQGAKVLFDGTSADAWQRGKIVMDNLLAADCETKDKFGDFTLHIEFRTPYKPAGRGQGRGNSGVYIQNRYECQVLDSFGLEGEDNECGGIYSIAKPAVNMCFPPLSWQTYDIDFTAARFEGGKKVKNARATIKHNGVVIHDDLELTKGTPGKNAEGPAKDGIYLQGHGNPVVYRNIWIVEK